MANKIIQLSDGTDNIYPCGNVILYSNFFTPESGYTVRVNKFQKVGHLAFLRLTINKGGTVFSGRELTGTLAEGFRPTLGSIVIRAGAHNAVNTTVNRNVGVAILNSGIVYVDAHGTTDVQEVSISVAFII